MGVNSTTARKLPAIVPKILNKKEAFLSGRFLHLSSSNGFYISAVAVYLYLMSI